MIRPPRAQRSPRYNASLASPPKRGLVRTLPGLAPIATRPCSQHFCRRVCPALTPRCRLLPLDRGSDLRVKLLL